MISGAVMIADDGGGSYGVADEGGEKNEIDIHQNTVCGDTVLTGKLYELHIVKHIYKRHRDV